MTIKDTFTRGWVSGCIGGIVGGTIGFLPHSAGISQMRFCDWSAILIYGRPQPFSLVEQIYALLVAAGLTGVIGILFAFLIPVIHENNLYFKGWIFFLIPWFMIYLLTGLAKTEGTVNLTVMTAISDGIITSIIGLISVYCNNKLKPH